MRFSKCEGILLGTMLSVALVLGLLCDYSGLFVREIEEESELREARRLETEDISGENIRVIIDRQEEDDCQLDLLCALYLTFTPKKLHISAGLSGRAFSHSPPQQG